MPICDLNQEEYISFCNFFSFFFTFFFYQNKKFSPNKIFFFFFKIIMVSRHRLPQHCSSCRTFSSACLLSWPGLNHEFSSGYQGLSSTWRKSFDSRKAGALWSIQGTWSDPCEWGPVTVWRRPSWENNWGLTCTVRAAASSTDSRDRNYSSWGSNSNNIIDICDI